MEERRKNWVQSSRNHKVKQCDFASFVSKLTENYVYDNRIFWVTYTRILDLQLLFCL